MMVGAFPTSNVKGPLDSAARQDAGKGLYPRLSHYASVKHAVSLACLEPPSPRSAFAQSPSTRIIAKESVSVKDASFISLAGASSKKYMPRLSTLPQYPLVEDIQLSADAGAEYAVVITMYEVYNDRIFDLLAGSSTKVAAQKRRGLLFKNTEQSHDKKVVAGLRKVICSDLDEALLVLETGLTERRVAGTGSNAVSSRSHGFFCVEVKKRQRGAVLGAWTSSTMTIVDLAGKLEFQKYG